MGVFVTSSYSQAKYLSLYRKIADYTGLIALYPFFSIIAFSLGSIPLLFASEVFLSLVLLLLSLAIYRLSPFIETKRFRILFVVFLSSSLLIMVPFVAFLFVNFDPFLNVAGKLIGFVAIGLLTHSLARKLRIGQRLDRYGGLIVLGSLILVVRDPMFVLAGLLLVSLGFGGVSTELRKFYLRKTKEAAINNKS